MYDSRYGDTAFVWDISPFLQHGAPLETAAVAGNPAQAIQNAWGRA